MTLPVWPSNVSSALGLVDLMSKSRMVLWPAAARKRLSGEMHSRLTCESGCWMVREQMPESASQNLQSPTGQHSAFSCCPVRGWV